jgi:nitroimidazol reductase NimA-like FMN-containing flavoprotein (pyridoxamine 5'-phosphate oxidase superfamily)
MTRYHLRRSDKELNDGEEIERVLASVRIMTVACCIENEPYLFTVDFVWEPHRRQLWFHVVVEENPSASVILVSCEAVH